LFRNKTVANASAITSPLTDSEKLLTSSTKLVPLRISEQQKINCRAIAKAFIRFIEPRKQVKHPYNRGKPPLGSALGTKGDPEKTKPE
ncbi:hypothetical protein N7467_003064, partial [Penicillium canescens]